MSGNYDYPPASSSRIPRAPDERPDILRLQHLRNLVSERNRASAQDATRALETLNQEIAEHNLDRARDRTNYQQARAAVDRQIQQLQSEIASPAERIRNIWYDQLRSERPSSRLSPEFHSRRRSVPWPTLAPSPDSSRSPSLMPPSGQSGRDGQGRQKRRKLDTDDNREGFQGFNYGKYGQVVPGELQMEIASCDGGNYDPDGVCSRPENVLDNNQSVYSTKEDRCNLVLCHRDEAPFCLKKIVIRAPQSGFDAPIQEGMVFVAMTSDELLARTAQYKIQYSRGRLRRRPRRSGLPPSQEYLGAFRPPFHTPERTVLMGPHSHSVPNTSEDPQAQFRITTDYEENSEHTAYLEDGEDTSAELDGTRGQPMERYTSDTDDTPSDEEEETPNVIPRQRMQVRRLDDSFSRHPGGRPRYDPSNSSFARYLDERPRHDPSLVHPNPPSNSTQPTTEVLKPHARFYIEREKTMVTIKFDPPPSGRFILIKLWSPRPDGNIDIESIIAHGYAGPRFFPSIGAR